MGSRRKGRDLDRSTDQGERPVATIVEYSAQKRSINAYPTRIISPPVPSQCCGAHPVRVGEVQDERGWPFVYQRCAACGFTVRRFAPPEEVLEARRIWRNGGREIRTPDAA